MTAPGTALNGVDGTEVPLDAFVDHLRSHRHVYVGERHREALSHQTQLAVLELLTQAGVKIAIAVEWLPFGAREALERYVRGELSQEEMLAQTDWVEYWGHSFEAYREIFLFARAHGVPIWPLNAPKGLARKVARGGAEALSPQERAHLTPLTSGNDAHRAFFFKLMAQVAHAHGHGHHAAKGPSLEGYYRAQLFRDETMAHQLVARLRGEEGEGRVAVVFAGRAHVAFGLGIPSRAADLGFPGFAVILPASSRADLDARSHFGHRAYPKKRSDFLWIPKGNRP